MKLPLYLVLCPVKSVCCLLHSLFGWLLFFLHPPFPPFLVFCFQCLLYALSVRSCLFGLPRRAFEVTSFLCTVLVINREWCSGKKNLLFRSPQITHTHTHIHVHTQITVRKAAEQEVDSSHAKEMSSWAGILEGSSGGWVSLHCHILGQFCHQPASRGSCDWFDARMCIEGPVISDITPHFTPSLFLILFQFFLFFSVALKSHVVSGIGFVT